MLATGMRPIVCLGDGVWGAKTVESCRFGAGNRLGQIIMRVRAAIREHQVGGEGELDISSDERELLMKDTMLESVCEETKLEDYQIKELIGNGLNGSMVYLALNGKDN